MSAHQFSIDFSGRLPVSAQIGMKQADDNANEEWKHIFDAAVLIAAKRNQFLTSDDVLDEMEKLARRPMTHNLSAIGPAMQRAAKVGKILKATDRHERSDRPEKHGNLQRVWQSLYWTPF